MGTVIRHEITDANRELLGDISPHLQEMFYGSVWQKGEAECCVRQTLAACKLNLETYRDPFSWLGTGTREISGGGLINNSGGIKLVTSTGHLVIEDAPDGLTAPEDTIVIDGKPQVLRITQELLEYARTELSKIKK